MNELEVLKTGKNIFFNFMKRKYPVIQKSNIFLRDLQFAIDSYFNLKSIKLSYSDAEKIALDFASELENNGEILKLGENVWKVNFPTEDSVINEDDKEN